MVIEQWTGDDGLISNNLTSVVQTSDGIIWVTSFNGAHRFDGLKFELFDKNNVSDLNSNAFYNVLESSTGQVFLGSQGSGILEYANGKINALEQSDLTSARTMTEDSGGKMWIGTNNEGVLRLDSSNALMLPFPEISNTVVMDIVEGEGNAIWIATNGNGVWKLEENQLLDADEFDQIPSQTFNALLPVEGGMLLGTTNGLYLKKNNAKEVRAVEELQGVEINDITFDAAGYYLLATEKGFYRLDINFNYLDHISEVNGLPGNQVSSIIVDKEGSYWLTTKKAGLLRMNVGSIRMLPISKGLSSDRINIVYENNGKKYIGADDGSIVLITPKGMSPVITENLEKGIGIRDFAVTDDGTLWIASYLGLLEHRKGGQINLINKERGLRTNDIRRVLKASDNTLWLASKSGGVTQVTDGQVTKNYDVNNGMNSNYVLAIEEDNKKNILVGTHSGGLTIIDKRGNLENYFVDELRGVLIFNIHVEEDNTYWLSTNVGVFYIQDGSMKKLTVASPVKTETFFDLIVDLKDNYWFTTNIGVIKMKKSDLEAYKLGQIENVTAELYDNTDGMKSKECTGATRSLLTDSGEIWVPTLNGVAVIDPLKLQSNDVLPNVLITHLYVDKEEYERGNVIDIPAGKVRYMFEFTATSYLASSKVQFKYMLEGIDDDFIPSFERNVEYTNLPPGEYNFIVMGANNDGLWNLEGDKMRFNVKPFFYETYLFYALLILLTLAIIYWFLQWRVRNVKQVNDQLSKVNQELDRFVYSASHDLRAPLASILGLVNIADRTDSEKEKKECLHRIEQSVNKLDDFISDIIDYSRNQRQEVEFSLIDLEIVLNEVIEDLKFMKESSDIQLSCDVSIRHFKTDVKRLVVVLKNLLANAIKYHDSSKDDQFVKIVSSRLSDKVIIEVIDNGTGIGDEYKEKIFEMFYRGVSDSQGSGLGLYIAKENLDKMEGSLSVKSTVGRGSTFRIELPLNL